MSIPAPREREPEKDAAPAAPAQRPPPLVPLVARYSGTTAYLCIMVTMILLAVVFDVRI